jgi:outer membrane protein assembly factor BamD
MIGRFWSTTRVVCLALSVGAAGCAKDKPAESPLHYTENAKRAYEKALEAYFDRDWEFANQLLQEVKRKWGYSRYARLAELRLADAAYHQEKYAEAVGMYKGFVSDYPNDPEVEYARFRIAKGEFSQSGGSALQPPLEERDLSSIRDAHAALRAIVSDYPISKYRNEVDYMLEVVTGLLVRHELYVARFYLRRDNFEAAVARCEYALKNFENSGLEAEALTLLGETYLKMKDLAKARTVLEAVLERYPDSAFTVPVKRFLARMGAAPGPRAPVVGGRGG